MRCDRCQKPMHAHIMSRFNRDTICLDCQDDEQHCPNYHTAAAAEVAACRAGNYNFDGIGLAPVDLEYLAACLAARAYRSEQP